MLIVILIVAEVIRLNCRKAQREAKKKEDRPKATQITETEIWKTINVNICCKRGLLGHTNEQKRGTYSIELCFIFVLFCFVLFCLLVPFGLGRRWPAEDIWIYKSVWTVPKQWRGTVVLTSDDVDRRHCVFFDFFFLVVCLCFENKKKMVCADVCVKHTKRHAPPVPNCCEKEMHEGNGVGSNFFKTVFYLPTQPTALFTRFDTPLKRKEDHHPYTPLSPIAGWRGGKEGREISWRKGSIVSAYLKCERPKEKRGKKRNHSLLKNEGEML